MPNISIADRLKIIMDTVSSQSFFITLFVIFVLTVAILIINIKVKSKAPKYIAAIVYFGLAILVLARYGSYVLSLNDSIVEKFFKAIYFPNLVVYLAVLILSILIILVNMIDKKFSTFSRIISSVCFFFIWFLFILVVDTVKRFELNFYDVADLYSNETIMILLQSTMSVFLVWVGVVIVDLLVRKIAGKMDSKSAIQSNSLNKKVDSEHKEKIATVNNPKPDTFNNNSKSEIEVL